MICKKELRKKILKLRDALSIEEHKKKSDEIAKKVIEHKSFKESDVVLLFASFKSEVDTTCIFQAARNADKSVYYPKVLGNEMEFYRVESDEDFEEGRWGIREPKVDNDRKFIPQMDQKVCVIMPGAVFDEEGNRIGYGGGYYDKYLWQLENDRKCKEHGSDGDVCKLALAFQCQMVGTGQILSEEHDVKPDYIATENQLIKIETPAHTNGKS